MIKSLTTIISIAIILSMIPLAYALIHPPNPAIYIVDSVDAIPPDSDTNPGDDFLLRWGTQNQGNVPLEDVTIMTTLNPGIVNVVLDDVGCTTDGTSFISCNIRDLGIMDRYPNPFTDGRAYIFNTMTLDPNYNQPFWENEVLVCGYYLGVQYCDPDGAVLDVTLTEPPPPDPDPEPEPDPEPDPEPEPPSDIEQRLTDVENRLGIMEQAWEAFKIIWNSIFNVKI